LPLNPGLAKLTAPASFGVNVPFALHNPWTPFWVHSHVACAEVNAAALKTSVKTVAMMYFFIISPHEIKIEI
jgi:hypothetical protein